MPKPKKTLLQRSTKIWALGLATGLIGTCIGVEFNSKPNSVLANQGILEHQWNNDSNYKRLRFYQTSNERMDRASYYFFLRPNDRKTGILKLSIKVPDYFDAKLKPQKFSLCKVKVGGVSEKTRCLKDFPAVFEISKDQTSIEVFPETPIPLNKDSYAVVMKIFNPRKRGMFQFQALSQSPGDLPISRYVGTWNISIR